MNYLMLFVSLLTLSPCCLHADANYYYMHYSPLAGAIAGGKVEEVRQALKSSNIDVNQRIDSRGRTALHCAAFAGDIDSVLVLLAAGADVNATDNVGTTPLFEACDRNHSEVAKILLLAHADPNTIGRASISCLFRAAEWGNKELVQLLLDYNADTESGTITGYTPLVAAIRECHTNTARILVDAGAHVTTPADWLSWWGSMQCQPREKNALRTLIANTKAARKTQ